MRWIAAARQAQAALLKASIGAALRAVFGAKQGLMRVGAGALRCHRAWRAVRAARKPKKSRQFKPG